MLAAASTWTNACPAVGTPASVEPLAQLRPGQGPGLGERLGHHPHTSRGVRVVDTLLAQAAPVPDLLARGGQRVEPPVVVPAHEMQGAPVEPPDHERAAGQGGVDGLGGEPDTATPHRQAEPAPVLGLHGEETVHHVQGSGGGRSREELGREPLPQDAVVHHRPGLRGTSRPRSAAIECVVQPAEDTPYGRIAAVTDPTGARFRLVQAVL